MKTAQPFEAYFDFDNTITPFDVLDDLIQRFSINEEWKAVEERWEAGEITSRQCLEAQLANVRVSPQDFEDYLSGIKVDPAFSSILALLRERGVPVAIVSDSFWQIISRILRHNDIYNVPILANELRFSGDKPQPSFPYFHSICDRCGNCKTSHLLKRNRTPGTRKIYVGDGRSDVCPAGFCEVLFAKGTLLRHYEPLRRDVIPFDQLNSVHTQLLTLLR